MDVEIPLTREEFNRLTGLKREERQRQINEEERDLRLKHERSEREEIDLHTLASYVEAAIASTRSRETFVQKLDALDAATIQALMQNEIALRLVNERIERMLLDAHVLADGRRVFKTRDGTQVFDEHGHELGEDVISPDEIDDTRPSWDALQEARSSEMKLEAERDDLITYQKKLDEARDHADDPDFTYDELAALEAELNSSMPDSVRQVVGGPTAAGESLVAESSAPPEQDVQRIKLMPGVEASF